MDIQENQNSNPTQTPEQNTAPKTPVDNTTLMGVFSYLGPLVIVSYLTSKDNPTVKFHIKQGLVLFSIEVAVAVLSSLLWAFAMLLEIVNLFTLVLSIIGILNVIHKTQKELPLVGRFAEHFTF